MKKFIFVFLSLLFVIAYAPGCSAGSIFELDFENPQFSGISDGDRVLRPDEATYCYVLGNDNRNVTSTVVFNEASGLVSVSFDVYIVNNTNAFDFTLKNANGDNVARFTGEKQEIMHIYDSSSSAFVLSEITVPKVWVNYKFIVDTENSKYRVYKNNTPIVNEWQPTLSESSNVKGMTVSVGRFSRLYIDNIRVSALSSADSNIASDKYVVDNEYKMITGIPYGTEASALLSNLESTDELAVCDKSVAPKSGKLSIGDTVKAGEDYYSLGFEAPYKDISYILLSGSKLIMKNGEITSGQSKLPQAKEESGEYLVEADLLSEITNGKYIPNQGEEYVSYKAVCDENNISYSEKNGLIIFDNDEINISSGDENEIKAQFTDMAVDTGLNIYVSENGDDKNSGLSDDAPFRTLEKCVSYIKEADKNQNITIYVMGDTFRVTDTVVFDKLCNLNNQNKLVLTSYDVDAPTTITGGIRLDNSKFTEVTDSNIGSRFKEAVKGNIRAYDLSDAEDFVFHTRKQSGWILSFAGSETNLYRNGNKEIQSRYPNEGYVYSKGIVGDNTFSVDDENILNWTTTNDIWIWSHFGSTYGGHDIKITQIDKEAKTVKTSNSYYKEPESDFEFYCENIPEELDVPGEWYYGDGILYYYPRESFSSDVLTLGQCEGTILDFKDISNLVVKNLSFNASCGNLIELNNCENSIIENCKLSGASLNGIVISEGKNNTVFGCDISNVGGDCVKMYGGNLYTLTGSGHGIYHTLMYDFSQRKRAYTGGAVLSGAGMNVKNCGIFDGPHLGLQLRGNNFIIENNIFNNLVANAKDMGALYTYNNYLWRGSIISNNSFKNIRSDNPLGEANLAKGIYLDNFTSGYTVTGNTFFNCDEAVHSNGGRNNIIAYNVIENTDTGVRIPVTLPAPPYTSLKTLPYESDLWKATYQDIDNVETVFMGKPYNSEYRENLHIGNIKADVVDKRGVKLGDNVFSDAKNQQKILGFYNTYSINRSAVGTPNNKNADDFIVYFRNEEVLNKIEMPVNTSCEVDVAVISKGGKTNREFVITSLNPQIASAEGNVITAHKYGTTTLRISSDGIDKEIKIRIK